MCVNNYEITPLRTCSEYLSSMYEKCEVRSCTRFKHNRISILVLLIMSIINSQPFPVSSFTFSVMLPFQIFNE